MKKGKLFVIEGTDASGKATQTDSLVERCKREGIPIHPMSFPRYNTPTGRIIAGPYLGKPESGQSYFEEGADAVHPEIASLFFAADRRAAREEMFKILGSGTNLVLDRYISSNMAHQGGKIEDPNERKNFFEFLDTLEHGLLKLPRPDKTVLLYVPVERTKELIRKRGSSDGHESSEHHLTRSEIAYRQLVSMYGGNWRIVECVKGNEMRTREDIHEEVFGHFKSLL